LLPTKLLGVVADHGQFPVERILVDRGGQGHWVGSAGHEEVLKLTDLRDVFEDEAETDEGVGEDSEENILGEGDDIEKEGEEEANPAEMDHQERVEDEGSDEEKQEEDPQEPKKRKRKQDKDPLARRKGKKGRNELVTDPSFFSDL